MKRYRRANLLMAFSLVLFLAAFTLSHWTPWQNETWLPIFYFIAQSCFIGCVADYIAVEALFRRPFHLPVGQLIPKSRGRIIRKLSEVNGTLLSRENLLKQIEQLSLTEMVSKWLAEGNHREQLERRLAETASRYLVTFVQTHRGEAASWAREAAGKQLSSFTAFAKGKIQGEMNREEWLDRLLRMAEEKLRNRDTHERLSRFLHEKGDREEKGFFGSIAYHLGKAFGAIDYDRLADAALDALCEEMKTWREPQNPFRATLLTGWSRMVMDFLQQPATEEALNDFGRELFAAFPLEEKVDETISAFFTGWGEGDTFHTRLVPQAEAALHQAVSAAEHDKTFCTRLDQFTRGLAVEIISYEHGYLGSAMTAVLESFTDEELNEFVESKVWHELEGIRINGAIVGLLAGCGFYLFLEFLWNPLFRS